MYNNIKTKLFRAISKVRISQFALRRIFFQFNFNNVSEWIRYLRFLHNLLALCCYSKYVWRFYLCKKDQKCMYDISLLRQAHSILGFYHDFLNKEFSVVWNTFSYIRNRTRNINPKVTDLITSRIQSCISHTFIFNVICI